MNLLMIEVLYKTNCIMFHFEMAHWICYVSWILYYTTVFRVCRFSIVFVAQEMFLYITCFGRIIVYHSKLKSAIRNLLLKIIHTNTYNAFKFFTIAESLTAHKCSVYYTVQCHRMTINSMSVFFDDLIADIPWMCVSFRT